MKKLRNIKWIMEILGISESKIRYMIFTKKIPHFKIGRELRFDEEEIKNWLKAQKRVHL